MRVAGEIAPLILIAADVLLLGAVLAGLAWAVGRVLHTMWRSADEEPADLPVRRCIDCRQGWRASPSARMTRVGGWCRRLVRRALTAADREPPRWSVPVAWNRCPSCLSTRVRLSRLSGDEHEAAIRAEAAAVRAQARRASRQVRVALVVGVGLICIAILVALIRPGG
jgi:hypothetical protein